MNDTFAYVLFGFAAAGVVIGLIVTSPIGRK